MARTKDDPTPPALDTFYVKIEPIDSTVPAFSAKATKIADPNPPEPPIIIIIPPLDPDPDGPPGPDWTPIWLWRPEDEKWYFCYKRISGAGPKEGEDQCVPPAPPGWIFTWGFSVELEGWIQGYVREDGSGPKSMKHKRR